MPGFVELQKNALDLPVKLRAAAKNYSLNSIFCTCSPPINESPAFKHAQLIEQVAYCLDYYPHAREAVVVSPQITLEMRELVLLGIYVYVWYQYDSTLQWYLHKPLLLLLQEHLEINALSDLDKKTYAKCLIKLELFCQWVSENQTDIDLENLYQSFPTNMRPAILGQKRTPLIESSWGNTLSGWMTQIGINGLF